MKVQYDLLEALELIANTQYRQNKDGKLDKIEIDHCIRIAKQAIKRATAINQSVLEHAIDGLVNVSEGTYGCDLHNELFNTDYFIIGRYQAEQWLIKNGGVFNAIEAIKEYEQDNFGVVNTDFSEPEHVCNMFTYIEGEKILSESKTLQDRWDDNLTQEDLDAIKSELEELL